MNDDDVRSRIVGEAFPPIHQLGRNRFSRTWVVRVRTPLGADVDLAALAETLRVRCDDKLQEAHGDAVAGNDLNKAGVSIAKIAACHLAVTIETPTSDVAIGAAAAVITWTTLRGIDEILGIDDLAGLPKELWFEMR